MDASAPVVVAPPSALTTARKLVRNTIAAIAGQVGTRALGFVYVAALARHVHPEGMGELATAQSLATIIALFISLGHDTLTVSELAHDFSRSSVWFSNLLAMKLGLSLAAMGVLLAWSRIAGYSAATEEVVMVYGLVMVVSVFVSTVRSVILARERQMIEAGTQFGRDVVNIGLSLVAIWLGAPLVVIVWVSVLANVLHLIVELSLLRRFRLASLVAPSVSQCRAILRRGVAFGAGALISVLLAQSGPVLLSVVAGSVVTGLFWSANNVALMLLVLPMMYYWAVLPVFSRLHATDERELATVYHTSMKAITLASMPLAAGAVVLAEPIVNLLYGPGFEVAATVLRVLAVVVALSADYVCGAVLTAMGKQRFLSITYGLELVALVVFSLALIPSLGAVGVSLGYAVPRVVGYVVRLTVSYRQLRLAFPLDMLLRTAAATAAMALVVYAGLSAGVHFLVLSFLVGPLVYAGALVLVRGVSWREWHQLRRAVQAG